MTSAGATSQVALGFRVKSGWATAIVLSGPDSAPHVLERRIVDLSDSAQAGSTQPYHAVMAAPKKDAAQVEERLCKVVRACAKKSVDQLLTDIRKASHDVSAAGLVVGSDTNPERIKNDHIRAHALEGRLFRTALADALTAHGLGCSVIVEREAYGKAAPSLALSEDKLKRAIAELGRSVGGPWRADEKMAALAAWVVLRQ